jgi:cytosine/adenosine deaminase-related metal-dependent hydrolase
MDASSTVLPDGVVWIKDAAIAAVTEAGHGTPEGFDGVVAQHTEGTVYPGLIDLHNHVAYNVLPLWNVPRPYTNRNTWGNSDEYHRLVTAPMKTIGEATELLPALVRYVELKALVGGVTTTQGIALFSAPGLRRYYRGIVRNVEETNDPLFPEAGSRIADVEADDPQAFLTAIQRKRCFLLHLSEGTDEAAHKHFKALNISGSKWAIAPSLAGIHCVALKPDDFTVMAAHGASMIWSPFSNLLLYGGTADVAAAKTVEHGHGGLTIGLGADWSPSGNKSLLGELKVARVYAREHDGLFTDEELVRMATTNGARILGWDSVVGSLERGKRADLVVVKGRGDGDDHYAPLFGGDERRVQLVAINGTPRYGTPALMVAEGRGIERFEVGGEPRVLYLEQETADPDVSAVGFQKAAAKLKDALRNVKELRLEQERKRARAEPLAGAPRLEPGRPRLALDEFEHTDFTQRPHLMLEGRPTGPHDKPGPPAALSSLLSPVELDPLTVADDPTFMDRVAAERNLPDYIAPGLKQLQRG